jgi:hypothetical protein
MTQDQYGQARGAGYGARGDVVEDENDEYADDSGKPMTRFQKVASALRGDRPEPDEMDDDQVAANQDVAASPTATSPDVVTDSGEVTDPDLVTDSDVVRDPDLVTDSDVVTDQDVAYNSGRAANSDVAANSGAATSSGTAADPDAMPSGQGHPPTQPNAALAGSPGSRDPLDGQEAGARTAVGPNEAAGTGSGAQRGNYWDDSDTAAAGQAAAAPVTTPDVPVAGPDAANGYASNESVPYQDEAGAATIPDVPVTQDAAGSEVPGRTGRHAGVPAQELRPGEATDTLDDLGDLAFGNLLPDAADFTAQWQQIQFRFVDDPRASVTEAAEVVSQVTAKMEAAIQERQRAIAERQQAIAERQRSLRGRWGEGSEADTETLRETLRMYRAFLDQLIGSKA